MQHAVLQLIGAERCDLLIGDGTRAAAMVALSSLEVVEAGEGVIVLVVLFT